MPRKPRVLMIFDDISTREAWEVELRTAVRLTTAQDLEDAKHILDHEPVFAAIGIGAFRQNETIHAIPFIVDLRHKRRYTHPIVGIAHTYDVQCKLIEAGCDSFADRRNAPDKIMEALKLNLWRTS